jgi:hypothetical protein
MCDENLSVGAAFDALQVFPDQSAACAGLRKLGWGLVVQLHRGLIPSRPCFAPSMGSANACKSCTSETIDSGKGQPRLAATCLKIHQPRPAPIPSQHSKRGHGIAAGCQSPACPFSCRLSWRVTLLRPAQRDPGTRHNGHAVQAVLPA